MITVEIPIQDRKAPPVLKFPDRCVNCGKPRGIVLPLKFVMGVQKRGQEVTMPLPVPLCRDCEARERKITNVTLVPFTIAGLMLFVAGFIPAWAAAPMGPTADTAAFFPITAGLMGGLLAGMIGGTLVEFGLRFVFVPIHGRLLLKRPLTILGLFNDSENVLGLSTGFSKNKASLILTFENDEIAREFRKLNPREGK